MNRRQDCQAHQLELETRIEALSKSQEEEDASRNKYAFLYDFAPVGYFTFDRNGAIRSVNLTGVHLLGVERADLVARRFVDFVAVEDRCVFSSFISRVFVSHVKETCRLQLATSLQPSLYVRIEAMVTEAGEECLAVLVDITEKKRAE